MELDCLVLSWAAMLARRFALAAGLGCRCWSAVGRWRQRRRHGRWLLGIARGAREREEHLAGDVHGVQVRLLVKVAVAYRKRSAKQVVLSSAIHSLFVFCSVLLLRRTGRNILDGASAMPKQRTTTLSSASCGWARPCFKCVHPVQGTRIPCRMATCLGL
jgi:hypothetical protein